MPTQQELHEKVLYPVTRVRASRAGGSGVLVYSREDTKQPGKFINIVLTCEHVIDESIQTKEEWDPVLKRNRKIDIFEEVLVEIFDYEGSTLLSSNSTPGSIIAYDKNHDIAAIKLHNPKAMAYIADIYPKNLIQDLKVFDRVWTSGCSLLHDAFASSGELTYLREIIDQKKYLMANAPAVFGNSGGGLFHEKTLSLLGLTSRVTSLELGFGRDVMTWMEFSTHPERMYEFFDYQELQFLYDPKDNYYDAMARRDKRQKDALKQMFVAPKELGES